MRVLSFALLALLLSLTIATAARADEGVIGTILEVEGTATLQSPGGDAQMVTLNTPVHLNDVVETQGGARVFILFIDDTQMILSEKTKLYIDEYVFDPDQTDRNRGAYSLFSGAVQYVSGLIAKKSQPDVTINTPVGSIGIRGTELWAGEIDGEFGVFVDEGAVEFANEAGESYIEKGKGSNIRGLRYAPTPAKAWMPEKLQKARNKVFLKRHALVKERISEFRQRHPALREKYKTFMKNRIEKLRDRRQDDKERRLREMQWDEDMQEGPHDLRMDVSPHEKGPRSLRQEMREKREERRERRQPEYNR